MTTQLQLINIIINSQHNQETFLSSKASILDL